MAQNDARINVNINQGLKEVLDKIVESELNMTLQDLLRQAILRALIFWWLRENNSSVTIHMPEKQPTVILNEMLPGNINLKYFGFEVDTVAKTRINLALPETLKSQIEAIANEQLVSSIDIIREAIHREIAFYKIKEVKGSVVVNIPEQKPIPIVTEHFVTNLNPNDLKAPSSESEDSSSAPESLVERAQVPAASGIFDRLKGTRDIPKFIPTKAGPI